MNTLIKKSLKNFNLVSSKKLSKIVNSFSDMRENNNNILDKILDKTKFFLVFVCLLAATLTSHSTNSYNEGELHVTGVVEEGYEPISGASIKVYQNDKLVYTDKANSKGFFAFSLELESEYIGEFTAPGMITKRLLFDTRVQNRRTSEKYFEFHFAVSLFEEVEGIDFSFFDEPLSTIAFIDEINRFFFRESETHPRLRRANEIHREVVDIVRRRDSYDKQIAQADQYFDDASYDMAKIAYNEAASFLPDKEYPKQRLAEIEVLLAERQQNRSEYKNLIASADRAFSRGLYESAREQYRQASLLMKGDNYANSRLNEIDQLIAEREQTEKDYTRLLSIADAAMQSRSYEMAKLKYKEAARLKPSEDYPVDKILEIDKLLAKNNDSDDYQKFLKKADSYFSVKNLETAKKWYNAALQVKPEQSYPQKRIDLINQMIDSQKLADIKEQEEKEKQKELELKKQREEREKLAQQKRERERAEQERLRKLKEQQALAEAKRKEEEERNKIKKDMEPEPVVAQNNDNELEKQQKIEAQRKLEQKRKAEEKEKQERERKLAEQRDYERRKRLAQQQQKDRERRTEEKSSNTEFSVAYTNAVKEGDKLLDYRQFYNARDAYQLALSIRPGEPYPQSKIREINQIFAESEEMADFYRQGYFDVSNVKEKISNNKEKKFYFVPFDRRRTGSYLSMQTSNLDGKPIRLFINYGKDDTKAGGFSITIDKTNGTANLEIDISSQTRWITEDNNWVSIYPLGGNIEVDKVKVYFGQPQQSLNNTEY